MPTMRQFYTLTFTVVLLITTMFTQAQSVLSSKVPSNNFFTNVTKSGLDTKTRKAIMQTPQMMKVKETLKSYQLYSIDESSLKKSSCSNPFFIRSFSSLLIFSVKNCFTCFFPSFFMTSCKLSCPCFFERIVDK